MGRRWRGRVSGEELGGCGCVVRRGERGGGGGGVFTGVGSISVFFFFFGGKVRFFFKKNLKIIILPCGIHLAATWHKCGSHVST